MNIYDDREDMQIREVNPISIGTTRKAPVFDTKKAFEEWQNDWYRLLEIRRHEEESERYITNWTK